MREGRKKGNAAKKQYCNDKTKSLSSSAKDVIIIWSYVWVLLREWRLPPRWRMVTNCWDSRLVRTRRLVIEIPGTLHCYLTNNQSEESHSFCCPHPKLLPENHQGVQVFWEWATHSPGLALAINFPLLQPQTFRFIWSHCIGHTSLALTALHFSLLRSH